MKTLYSKLALIFSALLIAIGVVYVLVSQTLTERYMLQANQTFNRDLALKLVSDRQLVLEGKLNEKALKETFEMYMTINPSIEIYLLDLDGTILAFSADPGVVKRKQVDVAPIKEFLAPNPEFPLFGDDPRSHDGRKSFSVTPVPAAETADGYLYVVLHGEMYDSIESLYHDSLLLRLSAWTLTGSLLFGLATGLLIFYWLTRRLRRLTRLMVDFRDSQFQRYAPYGEQRKGDEVDQLGGSFDDMAERMQAMLEELKEQDKLRRELVNNVSHDLRTPLTCLQGYLETLKLKGKQMTATERGRYLDASIGHSRRLGKLISELFELAKLDARAVEPNREPFSPAELLQDAALKFMPAATQKQIDLQLRMAKDMPFVNADIGLIERVLENLIGNALTHTPSGGQIRLQLGTANNVVKVSIADSGHGISAADLPHVFDRFYRGKRSFGDGSSHAGLGLAIAKHLVELHQGSIEVRSEPESGTCFSFTLPVWQHEQNKQNQSLAA